MNFSSLSGKFVFAGLRPEGPLPTVRLDDSNFLGVDLEVRLAPYKSFSSFLFPFALPSEELFLEYGPLLREEDFEFADLDERPSLVELDLPLDEAGLLLAGLLLLFALCLVIFCTCIFF
jgi:hypothetical protein